MTELDAYLREFDACAITPTRKLIAAYVKGQLGPLPRKSVMPIARAAGIAPRTLQELLSLHRWDEEQMRSILQRRARRLVSAPGAVAVIHPTVVPKRGSKTPGVDRQEIRATGRVANCCVIVHLSVAAEGNWVLFDGELYLPRSWVENPGRLREAGIPEETPYRTEGALGLGMLDRAAFRPGWTLFDPALALERGFLQGLEARELRYVTEVPAAFPGSIRDGGTLREQAEGLTLRGRHAFPDQDPVAFPMDAFPFVPAAETGLAGPHRLVVLRHPWNGEFRFFLTNAAEDAESVMAAALSRGPVLRLAERSLEGIGFGHFEVRGFRSLRRHLRLSEASLLFQSEQRARASRVPRAAAP